MYVRAIVQVNTVEPKLGNYHEEGASSANEGNNGKTLLKTGDLGAHKLESSNPRTGQHERSWTEHAYYTRFCWDSRGESC